MKTMKTFDCVEMKHHIQERIYDEIKDLSPGEELAYWRLRPDDASPVGQFFRRIRRAETPVADSQSGER